MKAADEVVEKLSVVGDMLVHAASELDNAAPFVCKPEEALEHHGGGEETADDLDDAVDEANVERFGMFIVGSMVSISGRVCEVSDMSSLATGEYGYVLPHIVAWDEDKTTHHEVRPTMQEIH